MSNEFPDLSRHPAGWLGKDLAERDDWLWSVDLADEAQLDTQLGEIRDALENGPGIALLKGVGGAGNEVEARSIIERLSAGIGTLVSQSAEGELVFSVRDAGLAEDDPKARGPNTRKKLSFHTDRCDVIGFACVQDAKTGGDNEVVSSVKLSQEIRKRRPDLWRELTGVFPYLRHTVDEGNARPYCHQPIFSWHEGHFACAFLRVLIDRADQSGLVDRLTDLQREALDFLEAVAAEPEMHHRFWQEPGDVLFLNNWVTLHRRTAFEDWPEIERRRHLLRVWISPSNSRPLAPAFMDNYGDVSAGAVRGGMKKAS